MADDREQREAMEAASKHRQRTGELYAQHRGEGKDELLSQAREESARADHFEERAQQGSKQLEPIDDPGKRAWYEPGSVADDKMLQFEEAKQGGILDEVTKYAARSVFDKEHRDFGGAKAAGKVAAAPAKAAARTGKAAARTGKAAAKGVTRAGQAAGKGLSAAKRGVSKAAKGARSAGRSILRQAAEHKKEPRFAQQGHRAAEKSGRSQRRGAKVRNQPKQSRTRSAKPEREPER